MQKNYDVIVVGLGAMGSAACYQLASRGLSVLGIDRYPVPHNFGSSHGESRVMRLAIGEGEHYTPLALRSYELFSEIAQKVGRPLFRKTGMLTISTKDKSRLETEADFFDNTVAAAEKYAVKHDLLDASDVRKRFPQFNVADDERAYYEYEAGFLSPEESVKAQLELAEAGGAVIRAPEELLSFSEQISGVLVNTSVGCYQTKALVLSAGPWLPKFFPEKFQSLFKVYRMTVSWFDISRSYESFKSGVFPVFFRQLPGYDKWIYGFPASDPDSGLKVAATDDFAAVNPENINREVGEIEIDRAYNKYISPCLPGVGRRTVRSSTCLITATPDSEFLLDYLPGSKRVLAVSACSGHGFKHSAAIGECIANLLADGESRIDLSKFALERLLAGISVG